MKDINESPVWDQALGNGSVICCGYNICNGVLNETGMGIVILKCRVEAKDI